MTTLERLTALKQQADDLRTQMKSMQKTAFEEGTSELFDTFPALIGFGWPQFAPYFNDGDPCEFSARTDSDNLVFVFSSVVPEDDESRGGRFGLESAVQFYDVAHYESGYDEYKNYWYRDVPREGYEAEFVAMNAVIEFLAIFDDDYLEATFGGDNYVYVTRDGVETGEYSHD